MPERERATDKRPRVLVLGGGFAGIGAAQKLKKSVVSGSQVGVSGEPVPSSDAEWSGDEEELPAGRPLAGGELRSSGKR